ENVTPRVAHVRVTIAKELIQVAEARTEIHDALPRHRADFGENVETSLLTLLATVQAPRTVSVSFKTLFEKALDIHPADMTRAALQVFASHEWCRPRVHLARISPFSDFWAADR